MPIITMLGVLLPGSSVTQPHPSSTFDVWKYLKLSQKSLTVKVWKATESHRFIKTSATKPLVADLLSTWLQSTWKDSGNNLETKINFLFW